MRAACMGGLMVTRGGCCRPVQQVSPDWKPYVGNVSWEDIEAKINGKMGKKSGKRKSGKRKGKAPSPPSSEEDPGRGQDAGSVIAAYTGGSS